MADRRRAHRYASAAKYHAKKDKEREGQGTVLHERTTCPTPTKRAWKTKAEAKDGRQERRLRPYLCKCGWWHLTHITPKRWAKQEARFGREVVREWER